MRKIKNCQTCKHWNRIFVKDSDKMYSKFFESEITIDESFISTPFGKCWNKIKYGDGINILDKTISSQTDVLFYIDGEEWQADFMCGENFGCIHHNK